MKKQLVSLVFIFCFYPPIYGQESVEVDSVQYERFASFLSNFKEADTLTTEQSEELVLRYNQLIR